MGFEDCGVWEELYRRKVGGVNNEFEGLFGTEEVSQRVADHATSGGDVSDNIGVINEMTGNLVGNCGTTEDVLGEVHGSLNQNILDSIAIYSDVPLKEIPEFGELSFIISAVAFGGFVFVMKRREIVSTLRKLFRK